jgi:hypothetical protein
MEDAVFRLFSVICFLGLVAFVILKMAFVVLAVVGLVLGLPFYGIFLWHKMKRSKSHKEWELREFSRLHPEYLGPDWLPPNAAPRSRD